MPDRKGLQAERRIDAIGMRKLLTRDCRVLRSQFRDRAAASRPENREPWPIRQYMALARIRKLEFIGLIGSRRCECSSCQHRSCELVAQHVQPLIAKKGLESLEFYLSRRLTYFVTVSVNLSM